MAAPLKARQLAVQFLLSPSWPGRKTWIIESLKAGNSGDINWFVGFVADDREMIIESIDALGGYSNDEKLAGLRACFREIPTSDARREEFTRISGVKASVQAHLGLYLVERMPPSLDGDFFGAVRNQLAKTEGIDTTMAESLKSFLLQSASTVSQEILANGLSKGNLSAAELVRALEKVREDSWKGDSFRPLLEEGGAAAGFAAVLSRDRAMIQVLESDHDDSKFALLAAARFTRGRLPVSLVGLSLIQSERFWLKRRVPFFERVTTLRLVTSSRSSSLIRLS